MPDPDYWPERDNCMHGKPNGINCDKCENHPFNRVFELVAAIVVAALIAFIFHQLTK